ncbi:glycoside hydrolase family 76 protein [Moniliophthora roreri MCA 2997]|uniref:Glycoside hydrolase family 76 protein n=2 Tax=Moniliophthora roreri TaxID=221103 RepID=V2X1P2_MONRO|nr:glycoside hydrolase family 76 protein [Moniliophthora roreri MCA 2997]
MITFILVYFLAAYHGLASAQNSEFVPNPAWQNPDITLSLEERVAIAKNAIEKTLSMMVDENGQLKLEDDNYGAAGRFFSQMAEFDMVTNQTIYKDQLFKFFPQVLSFQALNSRPGFVQGKSKCIRLNRHQKHRAHSIAATHAYTVYSDQAFLEWSELAWNGGESYTLSEDELRNGTIPGKNISIHSICGDLTMAGGTFWMNVDDSGYVNTLATASYLIATSLLAEVTRNQTYIDSATETEIFYFNHLRNVRGDVLDGIDASTCTPRLEVFPAGAGVMIEGLAVLASVAQSDTIVQHLLEAVNMTLSHREWHNADGVLVADSSIAATQASAEHVGQYVVRGLAAIYSRNTAHSDLRNYIREYLEVQYNAVLDYARDPGDNVYAGSWTGPPSSYFSFENQTNALSLLIAGIPLGNNTSKAADDNKTDSKTREIAGGVVGGLVFIALLAGLAFLIRRRRQQQSFSETQAEHVQPFSLRLEKSGLPYRRKGYQDQLDTPRQNPTTQTEAPGNQHDTRTGTSSRTNPSPPSRVLSMEPFTFGSMVPTAELVRLLNERLQPGQWREDEVPPDYTSHRG